MSFPILYLDEVVNIARNIDTAVVEEVVETLVLLRKNHGRLFIIGVGGSAGNASHAVNDFRKIANIESYCPSDNVSELTARANDQGFSEIYSNWLQLSRINENDAVMVFSVGGGNEKENVSTCLIEAVKLAKKNDAKIICICGKEKGFAQENADHAIIVPSVSDERITPHSEEFQGVIWHLIVSHPAIKKNETTWEFIDSK